MSDRHIRDIHFIHLREYFEVRRIGECDQRREPAHQFIHMRVDFGHNACKRCSDARLLEGAPVRFEIELTEFEIVCEVFQVVRAGTLRHAVEIGFGVVVIDLGNFLRGLIRVRRIVLVILFRRGKRNPRFFQNRLRRVEVLGVRRGEGAVIFALAGVHVDLGLPHAPLCFRIVEFEQHLFRLHRTALDDIHPRDDARDRQ